MFIGLGTANFGTSISESNSHAVLDEFALMGGRVLDTANNYAFWHNDASGGESEAVIGRWLINQPRSSFEVHTKIGAQSVDGLTLDRVDGLGAANVLLSVEQCLERLQTDYIDVLYAHIFDNNVSVLETWTAFSELVDKGIVRRLGVSNFNQEQFLKVQSAITERALHPISFMQFRHSLLEPVTGADFGVQTALDPGFASYLKQEHSDITLVAYSPLLDGVYENAEVNLPEQYATDRNIEKVLEVRDESEALGVSPSALVLWRLSRSGVFPLTMTGRRLRLRSNLTLFRD